MQTDAFGLPLTTDNPAAAQAYREALDLFLSYQSRADVLARLEHALELDDNFALAHVAYARVMQIAGQMKEARASVEKARARVTGASTREQWHVEVLGVLIDGDPAGCFALLNERLFEFPRDALPISLALGALGLFAFSGHNDSRESELAFLQSLEPHWEPHWWFDCYLGWALVETGAHRQGIELLDRSLQAMPDNAQAVHARAHGYYETGQAREGIAFIQQWLGSRDTSSVLYAHLRWHEALFELQLGQTENAHAVYREAIAPKVSLAFPLLILMDAASYAWRSALHGHPLGAAQMREVAEQAKACLPKAGAPFFNWHKALALACTNDQSGLRALREEIAALLAAGKQAPGEFMLQFCDGLTAHAAGNYDEAIAKLKLAQPRARSIGGSSAQQDVVTSSLVAALVAHGDQTAAMQVAAERSDRRASHLDADWVGRLKSALLNQERQRRV